MKNFEKGAQEVPGEKSPAEKSPEKIKQDSKEGFSELILDVLNQSQISTEELNQLGEQIIPRLGLLKEDEIREYSSQGVEGLRSLAELVETREAELDTRRDTKLLEADGEALARKNRTGEEKQQRIKDVGEKSNP